jgi:hypothetical protein
MTQHYAELTDELVLCDAGPLPRSPVDTSETIELVPGCTNLRISVFPTTQK